MTPRKLQGHDAFRGSKQNHVNHHNRLQPIIENLYHESQCGFRQGRSNSDAVFLIKLAIKKRREHSKETWILFLDLVKAFDRVPRCCGPSLRISAFPRSFIPSQMYSPKLSR